MKKLIFLLVLFCFNLMFSQGMKGFFPAEYVLKHSNDTIKTQVRNVGRFTNKKYYFATVLFKMKMKDESGHETWVEPADVEYIKITDENNIKHEYFSSSERLPQEKGLIEIMYEGKNINWYKDYYNPTLRMQLEIKGYLVDKEKNILYSGFFNDMKGKLGKIISAYPDLKEKLKSVKTDQDYIEILRLYDSRLDKK